MSIRFFWMKPQRPALRWGALIAAALTGLAGTAAAQAPDCAFPGRACAQTLTPLCAQNLGRSDLAERRPACVSERDRYLACVAETQEACGGGAYFTETFVVSCRTFDFTHRTLKFKGGIRFLPNNIFHLPIYKLWGVFDQDAAYYHLAYQDGRYRLDRESGELRLFLPGDAGDQGRRIGVCRPERS